MKLKTAMLGVPFALTVVVWVAFYLRFPADPLGVGETLVVFVAASGLVALYRWWRSRRGRGASAGSVS